MKDVLINIPKGTIEKCQRILCGYPIGQTEYSQPEYQMQFR